MRYLSILMLLVLSGCWLARPRGTACKPVIVFCKCGPPSVWGGWYIHIGRLHLGLFAHTLQCDQRWVFLLRFRRRRFGYRTRGDASPQTMTYGDAGWHWPWKFRPTSGRG